MNSMAIPRQPGERSLEGQRILITGAASGIGRATALLFAGEGARLALLDRDASLLTKTASEIGATAHVCDITDESAMIVAVNAAANNLGGLDGLVHSAGMDAGSTLMETSLSTWRHLLDINLTGGFITCQAAVPHLRKAEQATIVIVASGVGVRAAAGRSAYAASKAGLIAFGRVMAQELGPTIRVNTLCPGLIDTPMVRRVWPTDVQISAAVDRYALKRSGTAAEMAESILFLTSPRSSFVCGAVMMADGGQ